jgi:hypothetical protein
MKRHVSLKHRGLTPSRAKSLEVSKLQKQKNVLNVMNVRRLFMIRVL